MNATPIRKIGLSSKVLVLAVIFVLIGEVLIFVPSIANFRIQWLKARISQAEIAALAAEAAPDRILADDLRTEILKGAGVVAVSLKKGEVRQLMLRSNDTAMVEQTFDLRPMMEAGTVTEALSALVRTRDRVIGVIDVPPNMSGDLIEVAMHEQPLSMAMRSYALNILFLSVVLSLIVAALIFASLSRVLVRPMQRLSANMMAFRERPEDATRVIAPSIRGDEIGVAERELHDMQTQLQGLLQQKNRLANVGLAVSKVSHDLRNMLGSTQLISDRLAEVQDPNVQRFAPKIMVSLDRAISFLTQTLKYGQAQELPPRRERFALGALVDEVFEACNLPGAGRPAFRKEVPDRLQVDADREQLSRILTNLVRNAVQALESQRVEEPQVWVSAERAGTQSVIRIRDNGPGIPESVRGRVFEAFQSAARAGGTGLGLAISAELVEAHGGTIRVSETGPSGTVFEFTIPDRDKR